MARKTKRRGPGRPTQETDLRARLLDAARALFAEQGFEKTSTREIARRVGANVALIAYHFGGKEELYLAVMEDLAARMQASPVFTISLEGMDRAAFRQLLRSVIALHLRSLMAEPELMLIVQRELLDGAPRSLPLINGLMQQLLNGLVATLKEGKRMGFVRPGLHEVSFLMVLSRAITGYYFLHRQLHGKALVVSQMVAPDAAAFPEELSEELIDQLCLVFLDGALQPAVDEASYANQQRKQS